jgi:hypothetical protein
MENRFVDKAKENMGTLERLFKGLPIIRGYVDKDLRRESDYRLRQMLATELEAEKQRLYAVQKSLLKSGGLLYTDDVDVAVQKLQTLVDRIKTASYGYAGLFSAVKIREEQLETLRRFDVALAARVIEIREAIDALAASIQDRSAISGAIDGLVAKLVELNQLFDRRHQAVDDPELLQEANAPDVEDLWLEAADRYAGDPPAE